MMIQIQGKVVYENGDIVAFDGRAVDKSWLRKDRVIEILKDPFPCSNGDEFAVKVWNDDLGYEFHSCDEFNVFMRGGIMRYFKITTEGDCEGRSTKELCIVKAKNKQQAIAYCIRNGIKPYYDYYIEPLKVEDAMDCQYSDFDVYISGMGKVSYRTPEAIKREIKKKEALAKLTREEREILGL